MPVKYGLEESHEANVGCVIGEDEEEAKDGTTGVKWRPIGRRG